MRTVIENTKTRGVSFPPEKVFEQVAKVIRDEHFASSNTLKKFLEFIVKEKLGGRESWLKEYTIAVNVLNKEKSFNPQQNCIVRIHAVRLRKALDQYYEGPGAMDEIRISMPKGSYSPVISDNLEIMLNNVVDRTGTPGKKLYVNGNTITALVLPFHHMERNQLMKSFSDGLGVHLSTALMGVKDLSVISYNMVRRIPAKLKDLKALSSQFEAQYIFTGNVQSQKNIVRVTVEMIRLDNHEQVWCQMFEKKINASNYFAVQDEIVEQVIKTVSRPGNFLLGIQPGMSVMAVAS